MDNKKWYVDVVTTNYAQYPIVCTTEERIADIRAGKSMEEATRIAQLISAAPDMLQTLHSIMALSTNRKIEELARIAIAKAEGDNA